MTLPDILRGARVRVFGHPGVVVGVGLIEPVGPNWTPAQRAEGQREVVLVDFGTAERASYIMPELGGMVASILPIDPDSIDPEPPADQWDDITEPGWDADKTVVPS